MIKNNVAEECDDLDRRQVLVLVVTPPRTYEIDDDDGVISVLGLSRVNFAVLQEKGGDVRRENGRVHNKYEYDPVPGCLEGGIVQNRPFVDAG